MADLDHLALTRVQRPPARRKKARSGWRPGRSYADFGGHSAELDSDRQPIRIGRGLPPSVLRLAGAGLSQQGVGVLKTVQLDRLMVTSTGLVIAAARGSEVCKGDSGGPVVADGRQGPVLWGVASAVLSRDGTCGRVVVIAPARASF